MCACVGAYMDACVSIWVRIGGCACVNVGECVVAHVLVYACECVRVCGFM